MSKIGRYIVAQEEAGIKDMCDCGDEGLPLHTCPYADVADDPGGSGVCTCCAKCIDECTDDV